MNANTLKNRLFSISNTEDFSALALDVFRFQYENVSVYRQFCQALDCQVENISTVEDIPFLPIQFFKTQKIISENSEVEEIFTSSGTSGSVQSQHFVHSLKIYEDTFRKAFHQFYGNIQGYVVLALLPSYLERKGSSLIYMANAFIEESRHPESGFYLNDYDGLSKKLSQLDKNGKKILLIGVSFALLDLVERESFKLKNTIVMETGGMKGRRKEMIREELHDHLKNGFGVEKIHSEYGMTELLSQGYSKGDGIFHCPSTMQVFMREPEEALHILPPGKTGGLNIVDLANLHSCAFIATQDLGRKNKDGTFEVLGRFDQSDIRGCNLMAL